MNPYLKFGGLSAIIIGTLVWLGADGINDTKSYYKTISEVDQMGMQAKTKRIRVAGNVEKGSIHRVGTGVEFVLVEQDHKMKVLYSGTEPLPDTFKDEAQAVADGRMGDGGVFHASKIAAKCASKYEAKPGGNYNTPPVNQKRAAL
jgi:cytochrome c-type biogenesis protein CcmE